ncbi:MAG: PAS domain S-box protein, partial [Rubrivivax sp.]
MPLSDPQEFADNAAKRRRRTTLWMVGANACVAGLLAILVWHFLASSYRTYQQQARNVAVGLAAVAQLNVESEFDRVDAVMNATASELERMMAEAGAVSDDKLNAVLHARFKLLKGIEAFRVADADGLVRWGTQLPAGPPVNVSDRDYFVEARTPFEPVTRVAGPLQSRVSGHSVLAFVRPLQQHGAFAGILYVSIDVGHFKRTFERYDLAPMDAVTLRRDDYRLVARHSPKSAVQGEPGDVSVSPQLKQALITNPRGGNVVSRTSIDGEERTTAYRALDAWPFVVLAGVNNTRFFAPWRDEAWNVAALAALAWLLVLAATAQLHRANRREAGVTQTLADQGKRIQALLRTAGDGIHITDGSGHLVEMSDSFTEMLGSSRERLLGRHIATWDCNQSEDAINAWLARIKPGDRQRVDVQHRRDDGQVIDVELQLSICDIAGKLFVFASARDVTNERRLVREQAAMLHSDLVGMTKIENRTICWRNRAAERILGYDEGELQGLPVRAVYWDDDD